MQTATTEDFVTRSEARLPDGLDRLYVVGQTHGGLDDLLALDAMIRRDAGPQAAVLHAGGYIDKGNQVPELLTHLTHRTHVGAAPVTYLMGAHEWMMSRALAGDGRAAIEWLLSGAEASLDRWGVPTQDWVAALPGAVPPAHLAFLGALPAVAVAGTTRFVCSSFVEEEACPFGLFGRPVAGPALFGNGPVTAVGRFSALMNGAVPQPWAFGDLWSVGRIGCAVLERRPS